MKILKFRKYNIKKISFVFFILINSIFLSFPMYSQKKYSVVLDAGHGGKDHGASRGGYIEKKIALSLALKTGEILRKDKDIDVFYTRKKDVFIELHNRARIANEKNADLFVSIHCNANNSTRPHGAETYVLGLNGNRANLEIVKKENEVILMEDDYKKNYDYDPNSPETVIAFSVLQEENLDLSLAFGGLVQRNFKSIKRHDRKVKQANFLVLRETSMPSVLIELGFISNKTEGKFLNSNYGQNKMAKAIAEAIKKYITQLRMNTVAETAMAVKKEIKKAVPKPEKKVVAIEKVAATVKKENIKKTTPPQTVVTKKEKPTTKKTVVFKVQIAASRNKLTDSNFNFKGLTGVKSMFIGGYHKYYYGETSDFQEVRRFQSRARALGHKGAFVVAFRNGEKISLKEALKSL